jgi:Plavaka transposase
MAIVLAPLRDWTPQWVIDTDGYPWDIIMVIIAHIADLEEQWMLAALWHNECPNCLAGYEELDAPHVCSPRTSDMILADIAHAHSAEPGVDTWGFAMNALDLGLCGVEEPWWQHLGINIGHIICQDALHGLHKAFHDHDLKWLSTTVGEAELDWWFSTQPHHC